MNAELILLGLAITLEPIPMTGYILVLSTPNGTRKAFGYLLGWLLTLVLVVVITELFTGGKPLQSQSQPSNGVLIAKVVLGLALLAVAWRRRAARRQPSQPSRPPAWMAKLDRVNFWAAMSLGFLLQPWILVAAGAASITSANLSTSATIVSLVLFCLLSTASYLAMQVYVVAAPDAARARLEGLRVSLDTHRDRLIILLSVGIGLWLIADNIYLLAG